MADGPQPVITIAVSDALARIEGKLDALAVAMAGKAETAAVHELESRVRVLENSQTSQTAVAQALARSRTGIWVAAGALAGTLSSVAYMVTALRGHP